MRVRTTVIRVLVAFPFWLTAVFANEGKAPDGTTRDEVTQPIQLGALGEMGRQELRFRLTKTPADGGEVLLDKKSGDKLIFSVTITCRTPGFPPQDPAPVFLTSCERKVVDPVFPF